MTRKYFGTDGIRGTVGQAPITPDFVMRLAHAVGRVLRQTEAHPVVLIGKDTRISGYMLESALESGFNSAGVDVVLLGPVPTPAVAHDQEVEAPITRWFPLRGQRETDYPKRALAWKVVSV